VRVVDKFVLELGEQLAERDVTISLTSAARTYLAEKGYDKDLGARPLARLIQDEIKRPLGDELLFGDLENGGHVIVDHKNDAIVFEKQARPPKSSDGPKLLN
jgi:ATP-dependent Clp protease ATP-binding subunit ClpA